MNILIAGASGAIGRHLVQALSPRYQITALGRHKDKLEKLFPSSVRCISWADLFNEDAHQYSAVINLCGKNIAEQRWNEQIKNELISSRISTQKDLLDWLIAQHAQPHYYSASAIGIYGIQSEEDDLAFDEHSFIDDEHPKDFLSQIGVSWEKCLQLAAEAQIPVTITRFGVFLKRNEGMLKKLAPAFQLGLGSIIGSGRQVISWIDSDDLVRAYEFLLNTPTLTGPINITAPQPVTQKEFAQKLSKELHRPLFLKLPRFLVQLLFGEMGQDLLLSGQRVLPRRLEENGFEFLYPSLEAALHHQYNKN